MKDHDRAIIFSSNHDDWCTPPETYRELNNEFRFDFDPCPLNSTFDGLKISWEKRNFINPPYSDINNFLEKGKQELECGNSELLTYLIPARTDTKWFHTYIAPYFDRIIGHKDGIECEIRFIKGRLKFTNGTESKYSAPFPSMTVIFRRKNEKN
jgi:site-specific DNA-methyltransferase (adenine-specific)